MRNLYKFVLGTSQAEREYEQEMRDRSNSNLNSFEDEEYTTPGKTPTSTGLGYEEEQDTLDLVKELFGNPEQKLEGAEEGEDLSQQDKIKQVKKLTQEPEALKASFRGAFRQSALKRLNKK